MTARINGYNPIGICYDPPQFSNGHRRGYSYTPFYRGATDEPDCDTDDSGMIKYFNDPDVQKQLHVDALNWSPCSDKIWQLYTFGTTTIPLFESFKEAGLKMMFYSGNVDAVVPLLETQEYLKRIGWAVTSPAAVLLNPWVRTEAGEAKAILRYYYLRRILEPSFWKKVVSLNFDFPYLLFNILRLKNIKLRNSGKQKFRHHAET